MVAIDHQDLAPRRGRRRSEAIVAPLHDEHRNRDVVELAAADPALLAEMVATASRLASDPAVLGDEVAAATGGTGEFRLIFNTGASAGQTVFHVHAHVLAGPLEEGSLAH